MAADTKASQDILKASKDILEALDTAKNHFFCPNRVWAVAKEDLPQLIPDERTIRGPDNQDKHEQCTFDFCEQSRRDFTAVEQRHECREKECVRLQCLFSRDTLKDAAETGKSTVWRLDGRSTLKFSLPYMAISHVWSDGTGTGAWAEGEVNKCLYTFFQGIANQFQWEGIWWDTLCIPREKAARNKAIQKIQSNYQDARITLVHDCFLRSWKWTNAEAACFAILMSPWFSRGWTALELAKSRKVKVVFNGSHGSLIKDLDEEILAKATEPSNDLKPSSHKEATKMIKSLRKGITELDDLLKVLGPRFTSWPKDIAVISGLLVGTKVALEDGQQDILQQDIYKSILRKIGKVSPRHLFHNSAPMSGGFSWCPSNLFNMPIANSTASLRIEENGNVTGTWKLIRTDSIPTEGYNFEGTHPLIQARLNLVLRCKKDKCALLAESGAESIARALLVETKVKKDTSTILYCIPVGVAYFYPAVTEEQIGRNNGWMEMEVRLGDTEWMEEPKDTAWDLITKMTGARGDEQSHHSDGVKTKGRESSTNSNVNTLDVHAATVQRVANGVEDIQAGMSVENRDENSALISAAKDGNEQKVQFCLNPKVKPRANPNYQDEYGWTALHYATWRAYPSLVEILTDRDNVKVDIQDQRGQRPLHLAAERGEDEIVNLLLKRFSLDALNSQCEHDKQTALHRAAWGGSAAVVKLLLQKSAKADIKDKDENFALHIAAEKGFEPVVMRLIENSGLIDAKGCNNLTPLHYATMNGHLAVVQLLIDKKAEIKAKDRKFGWTALHLAAVNGHSEIVKVLLVDNGTDVNAKDDKLGWTALHLAAVNGFKAIVEMLLVDKRADVNAKDKNGWTALRLAAVKGHSEIVEMLLVDKLIDVNTKDNEVSWTVLHCALMNGYESVTQLLVDKDADINLEDNSSRSALCLAAENGYEAVVKLLVDKVADINLEDNSVWTAFCSAAEKGHEAVVKLLLGTGKVDVDSKDSNGWTPLSWAAVNGHAAVVKLLVEKVANVNSRASMRSYKPNNRTPLSWAAEKGHEAVVKLLLDTGKVDVDSKDSYSQTPLSSAAENGHTAVVKLLLDTGKVDVDSKGDSSWTPLSWAEAKGHEAIVKLLLDTGKVDVDSKDRYSRTPLSFAAENRHEAVVKLLLDTGKVDVYSMDFDGQTPLSWAEERGHEAIMKLLQSSTATQLVSK